MKGAIDMAATELELRQEGNAVLMKVRVQPKAKRAGLLGVHAGQLKVAVTEPPERGKANEAVIKLLAKQLGLSRSQLAIVAGKAARTKTLRIEAISVDELRSRLHRLLD